jgi:hypothetical protein
VYYIGNNHALFERASKANDSHSWYSENLSGLFKASPASSLSTYWTQNFTNVSQALLVMFQEYDRPETFTIGKYTSYKNISNEWISIKANFSTLDGSPLAMIPLSFPRIPHDLLLYAAKPNGGQLAQYRYNMTSDVIQEYGGTFVRTRGISSNTVSHFRLVNFCGNSFHCDCTGQYWLLPKLGGSPGVLENRASNTSNFECKPRS